MFNLVSKNLKKSVTAVLLSFIILSIPAVALAYIGNYNTHKFHHDGCRYVSKMNEGNKVYFETRGEAIDQGYVPCKICRP